MDFSTPFMTLGDENQPPKWWTCSFLILNHFFVFFLTGISILYAKPHKEKAGLFSFMDPLSKHVWVHVATAFLCISIAEFLLAKYSMFHVVISSTKNIWQFGIKKLRFDHFSEWLQTIGIIRIHVTKIPKNWRIFGICTIAFGWLWALLCSKDAIFFPSMYILELILFC